MRIKVKFSDDDSEAEFEVDEVEITGPFAIIAKGEYTVAIIDANGV